MKNVKLLNLIAVLFLSQASFGGIINVNNGTPSPGEYDNVPEAIANAAAGDTIYIAPTSIDYGDFSIDKQLHIIGPGLALIDGALGNHVKVGIVYFTNAAECSGSSMIGINTQRIHFEDSSVSNGVFANMKVMRCWIDEYLFTSNDIYTGLVEGCIFMSTSTNFWTSSNFFNCTIRNNIFNGIVYSINDCDFSQNVVLGPSGGGNAMIGSGTSSSIDNNIFIGRNNSVSVGNTDNGNCSFDGSNNNLPNGINIVADPMFTDYSGGYFVFGTDLSLTAGSPCLGTGTGGEDIGLSGGDGVFREDLEPSIPIIRQVNIPGGTTVPANATFNINIISEAHE